MRTGLKPTFLNAILEARYIVADPEARSANVCLGTRSTDVSFEGGSSSGILEPGTIRKDPPRLESIGLRSVPSLLLCGSTWTA